MKTLKQIMVMVVMLLPVAIGLYQFDFIKRIIASQNHRIDLPNYFENISIVKPEPIVVFNQFNGSITKGEIDVDEIRAFYKEINGEQIMVDGKPQGRLPEIAPLTPNSFYIIYRDKANQLNEIAVELSENQHTYFMEIKSSRE